MIAPFPRILPILVFTAAFTVATFGQTADLEILSVIPSQSSVSTDQTFQATVRARNHGPAAAENVSLAVGANALSLLRGVTAPPGWTCDGPAPRFGYAATCTAPTLPAGAEVELTLTLGAPQHTAMTYRVSALAGSSTSDPAERNNGRETAMTLRTSDTHAELSLSAQTDPQGRARFQVLNNGPHDARDVLVVLGQGLPDGPTIRASGSGWKCSAPEKRVACTRPTLAAIATAEIVAIAIAAAETSVSIEGRVRGEQVYDSNGRNNSATATVVATPAKSKRRAARP